MFYALNCYIYFVKLQNATNFRMCLRLTEMYSKDLHSQLFQYDRLVYNDTTIIKSILK